MQKQIDHILLGLLWLLAATLGTCFWFGSRFGFNIFSSAHWQYLAYMQASRQPVRPLFYISLTLCTIITLGGLYILMRPRLRRIKFEFITRPKKRFWQKKPTKKSAPSKPTPAQTTNTTAPAVSEPAQPDAATIVIPPMSDTPAPAPRPAAPTPARPPRLNLGATGNNNSGASVAPVAPVAPVVTPSANRDTAREYPEIKQMFTDAGYDVKKTPRFGTFRPAVIAIGTGEQVWIGGVDISGQTLRAAMDKLQGVFTDTLDDIEITINGFIIAPTDNVSDDDILTFENADDLKSYLMAHTNTPPEADERENYDAYSQYIDTVLDYMEKI